MYKILLVDDDFQALESTRKILELAQYEVEVATNGQIALKMIQNALLKPDKLFHLVVTDVRMPEIGGLELLKSLNALGRKIPVILMTAFGQVDEAVWAMKWGAVDFLTKPFKRQALLNSVELALKRIGLGDSFSNLGSPVNKGENLSTGKTISESTLIGQSSSTQGLRQLIQKVAPTHASVLLTGESGVGKEIAARLIHQQSLRSKQNFVALNCAALPENLIESELFGFEKGSFTGAHASKRGLFEVAHQGTLMLDEIGDMPIGLQSKLLRVLQEGEVRKVGSTESKKVDVRVIAATHQNLQELVRIGKFRQDLLFRLEVVGIEIPPLRNRKDDILELAHFFLKRFSTQHSKNKAGFTEEVDQIFLNYPWPGNVRELSNVIERAIIFSSFEKISLIDLPLHLQKYFEKEEISDSGNISIPLGTSLKDVEELLIRKTLEATAGDKTMTAKLLGINSRTIYRKLDKGK